MRRILTTSIILSAVLAGSHTTTAQAAPTCTITQQFTTTFVANNQPPPLTWNVGTAPTMIASCSTKWYVTFRAQCAGSHIGYHQCITNELCLTAPTCTPNQLGWGAGTTHTYDEPTQSPAGFTGYWTNGDGFTENGGICDWRWRVRETFKNANDDSVIKTAFTLEGWCP